MSAAAPARVRAPSPMRRREWPRWSYYPARVLVTIVFWPILRILQWLGYWPRVMSRGLNKMMFAAGPFEPENNDVLIASYFKSGTNWTMQAAVQIAHRGRAEFGHIHDIVPWYELPNDPPYCVSMHEPSVRAGAEHGLRIIKTHMSMHQLKYSPKGLYIWVVRDPKDVLVSSYHFIRSIILGPLMPPLAKWLDMYLSRDTPLGSWAVHLQSGWAHRDRDNVLFLTFEEMKTDSRGAIERMAKLMRIELREAELGEVIGRSSFQYMKRIGHKFDTVGMSRPWVSPRGAMVRRGRKGSASELLSPADQARIDDYWRSELERIGCDFPYDETYGQRATVAGSSRIVPQGLAH